MEDDWLPPLRLRHPTNHKFLFLIANIVTTSKALVTSSDALVTSSLFLF